MTIYEYIKANKKFINLKNLAKNVGISQTSLIQIAKGRQLPTLLIAARIVKTTNNKITYDGILKPYLEETAKKYDLPTDDNNLLHNELMHARNKRRELYHARKANPIHRKKTK